jgi:hypothetical protein
MKTFNSRAERLAILNGIATGKRSVDELRTTSKQTIWVLELQPDGTRLDRHTGKTYNEAYYLAESKRRRVHHTITIKRDSRAPGNDIVPIVPHRPFAHLTDEQLDGLYKEYLKPEDE